MTQEKKKAPLIISKEFPAKHKRAGDPTEFKEKILTGSKVHTIRNNFEWWHDKAAMINSGEMELCLKSWIGRPYHTKQEQWLTLSSISVQKVRMEYEAGQNHVLAFVDEKQVPVQMLALHDGLSVDDFTDWFFRGSKESTFEGVVIHFTKLHY